MMEYTKAIQEVDIRNKNDKIARDYLNDKREEEEKEKKEVNEREAKIIQDSEIASIPEKIYLKKKEENELKKLEAKLLNLPKIPEPTEELEKFALDKIARDRLENEIKQRKEEILRKSKYISELIAKQEIKNKDIPELYTETKVKRAVMKMKIYEYEKERKLMEEEAKKITNVLAKMEADHPELNLEKMAKERYKETAENSGVDPEVLMKFF